MVFCTKSSVKHQPKVTPTDPDSTPIAASSPKTGPVPPTVDRVNTGNTSIEGTHNVERAESLSVISADARVGRCYCGECKITVDGPPKARIMCHCGDCRRFTGAMGVAAQIYAPDKVKIEGETIGKGESKGSNRKACAKCGGNLINDHG